MLRILTMAFHRHHLPHYITLSVGCCRGHHEEEDARYTYVHLAMSNLRGLGEKLTVSTSIFKVASGIKL